jgi:hypothetical protein
MTGPLTVYDTGAVYTPTQIYQMAYPQVVFNDASEGAQYVSPTYTGTQRAGIAGYVVSDYAVNRSIGWGNGVAVMGVGVAHAEGSMAWGINTLLTDSDNPSVITSHSGRLVQNEFDFNITSAATEVYGLTIAGASVAQPNVAEGFVVNVLGPNIRWTSGFVSTDNAANNGLVIGYQGALSGANLSSQPIILWTSDSSGARHGVVLQGVSGNTLQITGNLHATGTVTSGAMADLAARIATLEQRLADAGIS